MTEGIGATMYHRRTSHTPESIRSHPGLDFDNKPRPDKHYSDLPSIPLDDTIQAPSMAALQAIAKRATSHTQEGVLTREVLGALCYYAAGITKTINRRGRDHHFRAAACTGALYHIDLYPVVGPSSDLDAGVYHFDPRTASVERLRSGDYRGVLAEASAHPSVEEAPGTIVTTSTWWRNAWKYRARTYRHAFWDSGTVVANLLATAHATDYAAEAVLGFADEAVARLLGIDPTWEAPLELVPIGTGEPVPPAPEVERIDPETEPLESEPTEFPLIQDAWRASTLPDGPTAADWRDRGHRPIGERGRGDGPRVELAPVDPETASSRPLHNTIHRRGSCREYERATISFRKISTIVDRAVRGVPLDVRESEGSALQLVDCYWIVNDIEDLSPGTYQYHPDEGALERLQAGGFRDEAQRLALDQELAGDAALCIYFMADLEAVTEELGNRGYRAAQLEAALTAGRLYLATYAHRDLGGTGLTFFDEQVTSFLEPRAAGQTPMFLYTLGRPA